MLRLDFQQEAVCLVIEDDGQGFEPAARPAPAIERGHGLTNIEERVRDLGATVRLKSAPGRGTRLEAEFPYSR
jgi:signal transduction histidine kinase